jgi:hypothetical protein
LENGEIWWLPQVLGLTPRLLTAAPIRGLIRGSEQLGDAHELVASVGDAVQERVQVIVKVVSRPSRTRAEMHQEEETVESVGVGSLGLEDRGDDPLGGDEAAVVVLQVVGVRERARREVDERAPGRRRPGGDLGGVVFVGGRKKGKRAGSSPNAASARSFAARSARNSSRETRSLGGRSQVA